MSPPLRPALPSLPPPRRPPVTQVQPRLAVGGGRAHAGAQLAVPTVSAQSRPPSRTAAPAPAACHRYRLRPSQDKMAARRLRDATHARRRRAGSGTSPYFRRKRPLSGETQRCGGGRGRGCGGGGGGGCCCCWRWPGSVGPFLQVRPVGFGSGSRGGF